MGNWKVTTLASWQKSVCSLLHYYWWTVVHSTCWICHGSHHFCTPEAWESRKQIFYVTVASITYPMFFSTYILFRMNCWTRNFHVWLHTAVFLHMPTKVQQNKLELLLRVESKKISNHSIDPKYVPNNEIKTITIYGNKK